MNVRMLCPERGGGFQYGGGRIAADGDLATDLRGVCIQLTCCLFQQRDDLVGTFPQ